MSQGHMRASTSRSLKHICGSNTAVLELFEREGVIQAPQDLTAAPGLQTCSNLDGSQAKEAAE